MSALFVAMVLASGSVPSLTILVAVAAFAAGFALRGSGDWRDR